MSIYLKSRRPLYASVSVLIGVLTLEGQAVSAVTNDPVIDEHAKGEVLVKYRSDGMAPLAAKRQVHEAMNMETTEALSDSGVFRVRGKAGESSAALLAKLKNNPAVEHVQLNYMYHSTTTPNDNKLLLEQGKALENAFVVDPTQRTNLYHAAVTPNDPSFYEQWGLASDTIRTINIPGGGAITPTLNTDIDAPAAWSWLTSTDDVIIAVLDSGINRNHVDLKNNIWRNEKEAAGRPGVDDDGNGFKDDVWGWNFALNSANTLDPSTGPGDGTGVAGIIAAEGNNGMGISGVTWHARIMPVVVARGGVAYTSDVIKGIDYAIANGAKIIHYGYTYNAVIPDSALEMAIGRADRAGVLLVTAAGDNGVNVSQQIAKPYPCASVSRNVLCVGVLDYNNTNSIISNYGRPAVDIHAPGNWIRTLSHNNNVALRWSGGTTIAASMASGVAALIYQRFGNIPGFNLRPMDVINRITGNAVAVDSFDNNINQAHGRLNAYLPIRQELVITAKGRSMNGVWPIMKVYVDGKFVDKIVVNSGAYKEYRLRLHTPWNSNKIALVYTNDDNSATKDRNLFVKQIKINDAIKAATENDVTYTYYRNGQQKVTRGQIGLFWGGTLRFPIPLGAL